MPWHTERDHPGCDASEPWAVVKDDDGSVAGCHATEADALDQIAALYASEEASMAVGDEIPVLPERWSGVLAVEGSMTDDGRMFDPGALGTRPLPLPLMWQPENGMGHDGAVIVGNITRTWRDGALFMGEGTFDLNGEMGREAARLVAEGFLKGVSIDVAVDGADVDIIEDEVSWTEIYHAGLVMGATLLPLPAFAEAIIKPLAAAETGAPADASMEVTVPASRPFAIEVNVDGTSADVPPAVADAVTALEAAVTEAFPDTTYTVDVEIDVSTAPAEAAPPPGEEAAGLLAAGGPVHPPRQWFDDPVLVGPTPLQVTDEGRVFGHLATWDTCHIGLAQNGQCVTAPRSNSNYSYFLTGEVLTAEGHHVPTGRLTVGTGHAALRSQSGQALGWRPAAQHYDNTGWAAADIAVGEDDWGIWCSGAVRPEVTEAQLREFRASPPSGDWRKIGSGLELVGVLSVNVPGFPVPRAEAVLSSGEPQVLVASIPPDPSKLTGRQLDAIAERVASTIGRDRKSRAAGLAARIGR